LASTKTLQTRIKHKYDTSTNWDNSTNPLLQGELGISNDDGIIKVGDGTNTYNNLEDTHVYPSKYYLDNSPAVPLIIGTQTKATGTWTGVSDTIVALKDGLTIKYWLPYAGSGSASLTLTLKDGTTTSAIPVYYGGTTRINAQYEAGCILTLTYLSEPNVKGDIKSAGWWADANSDTDTNIYDKTKYAGVVYAKKAISASNIITGNSEGYSQLNSGDAFDVTYPILYATKSITINKTGSENYILTSFTTSTTQKGNFTLYKTVFIKGTLSGTTFTPVSTTPLVQIDDTTDTDESYYYVLLGLVSKATEMYLAPPHPVYKFIDGVFSLVNTWRPVVDNLTSTDTDKSLSANQGKVLDDKKITHTTITTATDLDTLTTTGIYHLKVSNNTKVPTTGNGTLYVDFNVSTPYQIWEADNVTGKYYKRTYTNSSWGSWVTLYRTDTVTTATTSGSGNVLTSITATNGALSITKDLSVYSKSETYTQTEINNLLLNYVPKTGGEFTGAVTISDELYNDSATLGDVIVNGSARFNNTVYISQTPSTDTQAANKKYVDDAIKAGFAANDAMVFKGVVDSTTTWNKINSATHSAGDTYRVSVKGTYGNDVCEVGDLIICINDGTSANNDDWIVVQTNIDGAVTNTTNTSTKGNVAVFSDTTGRVIEDSGIASSNLFLTTAIKNLTIQTNGSNLCTYTPNSNTEIFDFKAGTNVTLSTDTSSHTHTITISSSDTHLTSKNIVGNSEATTNTTSVLTNGNVYLKHIESNSTTPTSSHLIKGTGSSTVETDSSGNIIVDSVPLIIGTQTTTTASWTGKAETISVLKDGMSIKYWLPTTSASNVTLNLTLKGGSTTGALPVYYSGTTRLTTHYAANNIVSLVYRENVTIGSTTIAKGFWCDGDYNSNTDVYVKQTLTSNDGRYPLLASTKNTGTTTTDVTTTAYRNNNIYMTPSTGALTVSKLFSSFNSNGEDDSTHCVDLQGEYSTPNYSSINTKFYMNDNGFYLGVNSNGMENAICTSNSKLTIRTNDCYIYSSTNFKLNTVESIKIDAGTDFKIYENGYGRFQIADQTYLRNKDNSVALQMSDSTMSLYGDTIEAYSNYGGIKFDLSNSGYYGDYGKFTVRNANSIGLYVPNNEANKTFKLYVGRNNAKIGFINTLENNNSYGGKIDNGIAIGKSKTRIYGMLQHQGDRRVFSTNGQDNTRSEGTSAKSGWIKLASISLEEESGCQHYCNLYFKIINKDQSTNEPTELFLKLYGLDDTEVGVYSLQNSSFKYSGITYSQNTNYVFLVKSSDLCYDLYVKKITSEDFVTVLDFHNQAALHNISVEWHDNSLVTTMPSNPIYPTLITKTNNLSAESITSKDITISNNLTVDNSITTGRIIGKGGNLNIDYTGLKLRKADATNILQFENTKAYPVQNSGTLVSFDLGASGYEFNNIYAKNFIATTSITSKVSMTSPYYIATQKIALTNGKVAGFTEGTSRLYGDGVVISNPKIANDQGWIRVTGTSESDTMLEIATGDDGGVGEQIVARQYNTSSAVANELTLLDKSGNTSVPHNLSVGGTLGVTGATTLGSTLTVTSDTTLKSKTIFGVASSTNGELYIHNNKNDYYIKLISGLANVSSPTANVTNTLPPVDCVLSSVARTDYSPKWLNTNNELTFGASGLQFFSLSGTVQTGTTNKANTTDAKTNNTPTTAWYHILRMNYQGSTGYYGDIALSVNDSGGMYWRRVTNGSSYGWVRSIDQNGGELFDGKHLDRVGKSSSWYNGRDNAMIIQTSITGYNPIISAKTSVGSWEFGPYNNNDAMCLTYITDTNYSAKTNTATASYAFGIDGVLTATTFKGSLSGNADTASAVQNNTTHTNGTYYPTFVSSTNTTAQLYESEAFQYKITNGTTSADGSASLIVGNNTKSGTINNKKGYIFLYNSGTNYGKLHYAPIVADDGTSSDAEFKFRKGGYVITTGEVSYSGLTTGYQIGKLGLGTTEFTLYGTDTKNTVGDTNITFTDVDDKSEKLYYVGVTNNSEKGSQQSYKDNNVYIYQHTVSEKQTDGTYKDVNQDFLNSKYIKTQYIEGSEGLTIQTMNDGKVWFRNSTDNNNYAVIQKNSSGKFEFRLDTMGATDNSDFHILGNTIYFNSFVGTDGTTTTYGSINSDTFNVNSKKSIFRNIVPFATENYSLGQDNDDGKLYWNKLYVKDITATGDVSVGGTLTTCNIYPKADNSYNLGGSSTLRWKNVYAVTFNGALSGNATTATQLATARTITLAGDLTGSVSFNGASNVTLNGYAYYSTVTVGNTNNYPYHRIAKLDTITTTYTDKCITLYISQGYNTGNYGIARVVLRTNSGTTASTVNIEWLVRKGFAVDALQAGIYNVCGYTYCDLFLKTQGAYAGAVIRDIGSEARNSIGRTWTLVNSTEVNNTTSSDALTSIDCYASLATAATKLHSQAYSLTEDEDIPKGVDVGEVNKANSATTADTATTATNATNATYASQGKDGSFKSASMYASNLYGNANININADQLYIQNYAKSTKYVSLTSSQLTINIDNTTIRNINPYADSKYNLGNSGLRWDSIYGKELRIDSIDNSFANDDEDAAINLKSHINFTGDHFFSDSTNNCCFDIDMDQSNGTFEIGMRDGDVTADWSSRINFKPNGVSLIAESFINVVGSDNVIIKGDSDEINIGNGVRISSCDGELKLYSNYDINISNRGAYIPLADISFESSYSSGYVIGNWSNLKKAIYGTSYNHNGNISMVSTDKIRSISDDCTDIISCQDINLYSQNNTNIFSNTGIRLIPSGDVYLLPGGKGADNRPSKTEFVYTGNIKGKKFSDDDAEKPTITNFSDIHSEKFEVDGKWNISVNSETGALDFCIK
jgi:hypothetical protein